MKKRTNYFVPLLILAMGCEGDPGPAGFDSLIRTTDEPPGSNCAIGGLKLDIGLDTNKNGVLDESEINISKYICSGIAGESSLIKTSSENVGTNCPIGGLKIEAGIDLNRNGALDQNEVQSTQFVCNGANGLNSLVSSSIVSPGESCSDGGVKLDLGMDINKNGTLDEGEVQSTRFICNGKNGVSLYQVRFQLISLTGIGSSSTTGDLAPAWQYLRKFRKSDYNSMQSAILSAHIYSNNSSFDCIVDLFNLTDNVPITGSEVTTSSTSRVWIDSENFMNNIPDKEIDLAVRIRTSSSGGFSNCVQAYLILSKN